MSSRPVDVGRPQVQSQVRYARKDSFKPILIAAEERRRVIERFMARSVPVESGCWEWQGALSPRGYGSMKMHNTSYAAHRVSWALFRGEPDPRLVIDHLCRNTSCVHPDHLDLVTQRENLLRAPTSIVAQALKTYCKRGHEFTPENTGIRFRGTYRMRSCRTCEKVRRPLYYEQQREYRRNKRAAERAARAAS